MTEPAYIVVIEDDPPSRDLITYLLRAHGYAVAEAADGILGWDLLQGRRPDLIICDIHMPGLDGRVIAARVRADPRLRGVPLFAVTASAMVGDRQSILRAGFNAYIAKPITPEHFVAQIEAALPADRRAGPPSPHGAGGG
jgi:CheY-like chemotaxis protein